MRCLKKLSSTLFLSLFICGYAFAQNSDFQVKENFNNQRDSIETGIENSSSIHEVDSLYKEIDELKTEFWDHKNLIDHAIYPEDFATVIQDLNRELKFNESKILIIESQRDRIAAFSNEFESFKKEIVLLNGKTDSLRSVIKDINGKNIDQSKLIAEYQNRLRERDALVMNMVDSLFQSFKKLEEISDSEIRERLVSRSIQNGKDPLYLVETIISENIEVLKHNQEDLSVEDHLRMYAVYNHFEEVWSEIGEDLTKLYAQENATARKNNLDEKIDDWRASASRNMWASLDRFLEENKVELTAFDNNQSFFAALESFVGEETAQSKDKMLKKSKFEEYQTFFDIWNNKIKAEWGDYVHKGEVLTMQQISTNDADITNWKGHAQPRSFVIPVLLGLSLLTIVGLIIALARKK